jgi:hypothetical protein
VSYRAGITGTMAAVLRVEPTEPCIVCDGCGLRRTVYSQRGIGAPAAWFLDRKPAPGWELVRVADERGWDYCPACKAKRKEAAP